MPSAVARAGKDDRDPLEIQLDGNLRTLHRRGLSDPRVYDLDGLLLVARALSRAATDEARIEDALALAIGDYGEPEACETVHLWFGLHPKTQDTRELAVTKRHEAAWEYAEKTAKQAFHSFRTHGTQSRVEFLARRLYVRYMEKDAEPNGVAELAFQTEKDEPAADPKQRQLHMSVAGQLKSRGVEPAPSSHQRPTRRHGWLLKRELHYQDSPLEPSSESPKSGVVVKAGQIGLRLSKRKLYIEFEVLEAMEILAVDLLVIALFLVVVVGGVILGVRLLFSKAAICICVLARDMG